MSNTTFIPDERIQEMRDLIAELNPACDAYYNHDTELMPNHEFDQKYDRLTELEALTGVTLPNSPTQLVGYYVSNALSKVTHKYPALSLQKTKDRQDILAKLKERPGVLSWKLDGLTLQVTYDNHGDMVSAVTRGNGIIGEDVTHNAPFIKGLPQSVNVTQETVVRCEVITSYSDFMQINADIENPDEQYKNPRNLTSGSLRLLDTRKTAIRKMQIRAFELVAGPDSIQTIIDSFNYMESLGLPVVEHYLITEENFEEIFRRFETNVQTYDIPTDGLVFTYNDIAFTKRLGMTNKFPKGWLAFKWQDDTVDSQLLTIDWSASKTGLINPVAVFTPVEIEGTTVSRASVHNLSVMQQLHLAIGHTVQVYKANKIIPQIASCDATEFDTTIIPKTCPVCGKQTIIRCGQNDSLFLYCSNPDCEAKHIGTYERMVSRKGLNIQGLSTATLQDFLDHGYLHTLSDIFEIQKYKYEILSWDGYGTSSYQHLITAIQNARHTTFRQFIYALGMEGVGENFAKLLEQDMPKSSYQKKTDYFYNILQHPNELLKISGIGNTTIRTIYDWFTIHQDEYLDFLSYLSITDNNIDKEQQTKPFEGLTFVITGSLNHYENRNALKAEIEQNGGKVAGSVSKKTDYLINNDSTSASSKNQKAQSLQIPILTEDDYLQLLKNTR